MPSRKSASTSARAPVVAPTFSFAFITARSPSIEFDADGLDDLRPHRVLVLHDLRQFLRRAADSFRARGEHHVFYFLRAEDLHGLLVHARDDFLRRLGRREKG